LTTPYCGGYAGNFRIRARIDPIVLVGAPVGGFMELVNRFAIFAPYLALFGVVAAIAVVVAKPRKKRN